MKLNPNYANLQKNYLFAEIANRVKAYSTANPNNKLIKLGIGDVSLPLVPVVVEAMKKSCDEMGKAETFQGYPPAFGYDFLREAISNYYNKNIGAKVAAEEIYISDGAKSDTANILDIFDKNNKVLIPDPVYPVYLDTNVMDGREIIFAECSLDNGFLPLPRLHGRAANAVCDQPRLHGRAANAVCDQPNSSDNSDCDIIYICSPNNPTGAVYNREQLKSWVDYAINKNAIILFDAAYEAFITDPTLPRSIFEIEGAEKCAIEFCSMSKTAGFTGTRLSYTVIPSGLKFDMAGELTSVADMWAKRQATKFNGVPYVVQRGAEAAFTDEGLKQISANLAYYKTNAKYIADTMTKMGIDFVGGVHSPYIWLATPNKMDSWKFFDKLLNEIEVVGTPGSGFGKNGQGYFRLTSFNSLEATKEAMERFATLKFN